MQSQFLVSVIIIFFNASDFLQEAVESVLAQTYQHWELLLVDDGSTDRSRQMALSYCAQDPVKIRYFEHSGHNNLGMSASRNLGIRHAHGKYIAFLDADDVWLPGKLQYQVQIMESQPAAGMIYGNTLYWHSWTGREKDRQLDHIPALGVEPNKLFQPPHLLTHYLNGQSAVPCTCSIMVRSETVKNVGEFEDSFQGMYEDQVFYSKIAANESIFVSDACLDRYRQHPGSHTAVAEASGHSRISRLKYLYWLDGYLSRHHLEDPLLLLTLRQELWLNRQSIQIPWTGDTDPLVRWVKKWLLRIAKWLLPLSLRLWIWNRIPYR